MGKNQESKIPIFIAMLAFVPLGLIFYFTLPYPRITARELFGLMISAVIILVMSLAVYALLNKPKKARVTEEEIEAPVDQKKSAKAA